MRPRPNKPEPVQPRPYDRTRASARKFLILNRMTVLVVNDTPPAIRGMLKRWFVEPKPNVFVGTINRRTRDKVLDYVKRNAEGMSLLILTSEPNCQGFKIERWGEPDRRDTEMSGLWLVAEKWAVEENRPF